MEEEYRRARAPEIRSHLSPPDSVARMGWMRHTLLVLTVALPGMLACTASTQTASPSAAPPAPASVGLEAAIARARADSLRYPYTVADVQFMTHMIGHHGQAIEMSRLAPERAGSSALRTLAARIISSQEDEIATMQRWLEDRRQPVPSPFAPMMMTMNGMEHEMLMPGMLTPAQMTELRNARGAAFDRLYLTGMIQHHRGATSMVRDLFGTEGAAQDETIFKFANDVNVDQTTEIARMERMLAAMTP